MCQAMEELCAWERKRTTVDLALRMLQAGKCSVEDLVELFNIPFEEAKEMERKLLGEA